MTHLSEDRVKDLFRDIEGRIERRNPKPIRYLKNLNPSKDEIEGLEWRYRLSGYLEGLAVSDQIDNGFIEPLVATLFSRADVSDGDRPGRARPFSIDIVTEQRKTFSFDVPAMNPLDAYVQLTKRTAYKAPSEGSKNEAGRKKTKTEEPFGDDWRRIDPSDCLW